MSGKQEKKICVRCDKYFMTSKVSIYSHVVCKSCRDKEDRYN